MTTDDATGWRDLQAHIGQVYGEQEPLHFGTLVSWELGGPDPLRGISIYTVDEPRPHWHYVGFGMSELFGKNPEGNPDYSGFGFELTLRLTPRPDEDISAPPQWPLRLLQNLGRYVFETGNLFAASHHLDLNGPMDGSDDTELVAVALATDPTLGTAETANGKVEFLQLVGLTADELDTIKDWNTEGVLAMLAGDNPLLVTDLLRRSLLSKPAIALKIKARIEAEGSSYGGLFASVVEWGEYDGGMLIRLEARVVQDLGRLLRGRIPYDRVFDVEGEAMQVVFVPGDDADLEPDGHRLLFTLTPDQAKDLAGRIPPERGEYPVPWLPGLIIEVVPSQILDEQGQVVEEIG